MNPDPNPYRAPATSGEPEPQPGHRPYRSLLSDVRPLRIALFGYAALALLMAGLEALGAFEGALASDEEGIYGEFPLALLSGIVLWYVATIILFARFLVRANHNARAFALRSVNYSPASMVWWFFVPIANFFVPFNAVKNVYEASGPTQDATTLPRYAHVWWGAWVVMNIMDNAGMRVDETSVTLLAGIASVGAISATIAAYFGSQLMGALALQQHETAQKLGHAQ